MCTVTRISIVSAMDAVLVKDKGKRLYSKNVSTFALCSCAVTPNNTQGSRHAGFQDESQF